MATRAQLRTWLGERLRDAANFISAAERDTALNRALEIYNRHRPRRAVVDLAGSGVTEYALGALWIPAFSTLLDIELPVGNRPPTFLEKNDVRLYDDAGVWRIQFLRHTPSAADTFRLRFTSLHSIPDAGEATVYPNDVYAFAALGASVCMLELAARALEGDDTTINADAVDWQSQPQEYRRLAGSLMDEYLTHVGADGDGDGEGSGNRAAVGFRDLDSTLSGGWERLFHPSVVT